MQKNRCLSGLLLFTRCPIVAFEIAFVWLLDDYQPLKLQFCTNSKQVFSLHLVASKCVQHFNQALGYS